MRRRILLAFVCAAACLPSYAHEDWDVWESDWTGEAGLLVAPGAEDPALYRLGLGFETNRVLENGLELGAAFQVDAELDHATRSGFSGIVADPAAGTPALTGAVQRARPVTRHGR